MPIYTKTGDDGETGLFGGGRVAKDHPRVTAYGEVDELNAAIGLVLAGTPEDFEAAALEAIQRDLFAIGGQLATPDPKKVVNHKLQGMDAIYDRHSYDVEKREALDNWSDRLMEIFQ